MCVCVCIRNTHKKLGKMWKEKSRYIGNAKSIPSEEYEDQEVLVKDDETNERWSYFH